MQLVRGTVLLYLIELYNTRGLACEHNVYTAAEFMGNKHFKLLKTVSCTAI